MSKVAPFVKLSEPPVMLVLPLPEPFSASRCSVKLPPMSLFAAMLPLGVRPVKKSIFVAALLAGGTPRFQLPPLLHPPLESRLHTNVGTLAALFGSVPAWNSTEFFTPSPSGSASAPMMSGSETPGQFDACHAANPGVAVVTVTARSRDASPSEFVPVSRST